MQRIEKMKLQFEHTTTVGLEDYVKIWSVWSRKRKHRVVRISIIVLLVILSFLSKYTLVLGIIVGFMLVFTFVASKKVPGTNANRYKQYEDIFKNVTYGMDDFGLWMCGNGYDVKIEWSNIKNCRERDDWIVLWGFSTMIFYFRVSELKQNELYEPLIHKCNLWDIDQK